MRNPTDYDIDVLARTCYGEARGEGLQAMIGVAYVAMHRADIADSSARKQFGSGTIASACLAPEQFDCWNPGDVNRIKLKLTNLEDPNFRLAWLAALSAVTGTVPDPTQGATGYWDDSIATPAWAEGKDYVSLGRLKFVKDI